MSKGKKEEKAWLEAPRTGGKRGENTVS